MTTVTANPQATRAFVTAAAEAGVPRESLQRFVAAGYIPQPKQLIFHGYSRIADTVHEIEDIGYGGARGGGKTHCGFAQITIDDCQMVPNLSCLFLREKAGSAQESMQKLCNRILPLVPHEPTRSLITFPNGSSVKIGHFQYEKDINQYLSLEYDVIFIEQAEQLSKGKLEEIKTVNRTSLRNYKPRMYYTFNPGGISHQYLKNKFIIPHREGRETTTRFVFANVEDNKRVDPYYKSKLEALSGWKRRAWLDGDWDIFAGQYFGEFNYERHVIPPESIPLEAAISKGDIWGALDYGFKHYTVAYLFCEYDGDIYVVDEYYARKELISTNVQGINAMLERNGLTPGDLLTFVAGHDVFASRGDRGESLADEFSRCGLTLYPANVSRKAGAAKILQMLGSQKQDIPPAIKLSSRCTGLIECLPTLQHNPKDPEDVRKIDTDDEGRGGDDWYDGFRYGVMATRSVSI